MKQLNIGVPKPAWERGKAWAPGTATDPPLLPDEETRGPDQCKGPQGAGAVQELRENVWGGVAAGCEDPCEPCHGAGWCPEATGSWQRTHQGRQESNVF